MKVFLAIGISTAFAEVIRVGWAPLPQVLHEEIGRITMTFYAPINVTSCQVSTNDGTALEESGDYKGINQKMLFHAWNKSVDVELTILDDNVCESTEFFQLIAECDSGYTFDANITILPSDPPSYLMVQEVSVKFYLKL